MGLVAFVIEIIVAYFLGIVLFYIGVFFFGAIIAIGSAIYLAFKWLVSHLLEIFGVILFIIAMIYLVKLIRKKRAIPRIYQVVKGSLSVVGIRTLKAVKMIIKPIKEWNEKHKPKDIKSMRKFGFTSFLIGLGGAVVFYLNGLWIVSLIYLMCIVSGIYQMLYPQKALKNMNK
jgi:MFS family permease